MRHTLVLLALSLILSAALAQEAVEPLEPATSPTAGLGEAEPDMERLFENVNSLAQRLQSDLETLESDIQGSRESIDRGGEVLENMLGSVTRLNESLAEDGPIWSELDALLELWEQRRTEALERSETNPAFTTIADEWKTRISTARDLRNQISTERANSLALIQAIEADREIVLAYYELGQADKAIEGLTRVQQSLQDLNANMQSIVETAGSVQRPISN